MKPMLLLAPLSAGILASCAPSTPEARIAAQPALFAALPAKQKELVRQGQIDKGMGTDAVYLAWGRASREYDGYEGSARTLRWDYNGSTPVYSPNGYFGAYGWGYGRFGPYYGHNPYHFYGIGVGPDVTYVPYRRASVLFRDGRVSSWERSR
jgi:hypothetical protein